MAMLFISKHSTNTRTLISLQRALCLRGGRFSTASSDDAQGDPQYFTNSMAESVFTDSKTQWAMPAKVEKLYPSTVSSSSKWCSAEFPFAGARVEKPLPRGDAALQLYSLATPNGQKVGILLEELGVPYDAHVIDILKGDQFTSGFVSLNPNSKIPALIDASDGEEVRLFESGSIVVYLAHKYQRFIPPMSDHRRRAECMNWVFWQMAGVGPMAGQLWHFLNYAPATKTEAKDYGVARYGMAVQRLFSVLDNHLEKRTFIVGEEYSVADIMILPWFHLFNSKVKHSSGVRIKDFLSMDRYRNVQRWEASLLERDGVKRGMQVCSFSGIPKPWLKNVGP